MAASAPAINMRLCITLKAVEVAGPSLGLQVQPVAVRSAPYLFAEMQQSKGFGNSAIVEAARSE
jgi:hypothetical protein